MSEQQSASTNAAVSDTTRDIPGPSPDDATSSLGGSSAPVTETQTRAVPLIGQELGPVQLISELGRGAAGVVFLGHHKLLGRSVAVKCLVAGAGSWGEAGSKRFMEEARAAAAVKHANLTQIHHADIVGGMPFLVMELVDGPTLARLLSHAGRISPALARGIMSEVAAAVAELHDRGLIHRDLKHSNVLIDRQGRVCVSDFGLAVRRTTLAASSTASPEIAGTPAYMAPEMFDGRVSPRSDIYAMGVMMCQLLTGKPPFGGNFEQIVEEHKSKPLPLEELRGAGADDALIDLLERATHKQFLYRYKTAHEFRRALAALGTDAADCKRELARLVLAMQSGVAPGTASASPTSTTKMMTAKADGDLTYAQTIARLASTKRERRATPPMVPAVPLPPPISIAPFPPAPPVLPSPDAGVEPAFAREYFVPTQARPAILTALCTIGIVVATFGLAGLLISRSLLAGIKPSASDVFGGLRLWGIVLTAINAILTALLFTGSIAALRLKPWARPIWRVYVWAEFPLQLLIAIIGLRFIVPRFLDEMRANAHIGSPEQRQQLVLNVRIFLTMLLVLRCGLVCAFATAAAIVLRLPLVKLALGRRNESTVNSTF